jgi:sec-independent protein translocase protein TatC
MRVALMLGATLAMPIIIYEVVAFVVPGLTATEKRLMFLAIPAIFVCFLAGAAFAYFVMLPAAIPFLLNFGGIPTMPRPRDYIGFSTRVIFWMGVAFQTPLLIALLARVGVITPELLIRSWRIAVVVMAVLAALITPTIDPFNMMIVMAPLLILYLISIVLAKWAYRERQATPTGQQAQTDP